MKEKAILYALASIGVIAILYIGMEVGIRSSIKHQSASLASTKKQADVLKSAPVRERRREKPKTIKEIEMENPMQYIDFTDDKYLRVVLTRKLAIQGNFQNHSKTIFYNNPTIEIVCFDANGYELYRTKNKYYGLIEWGTTPYDGEIKVPLSVVKTDIKSVDVRVIGASPLQQN